MTETPMLQAILYFADELRHQGPKRLFENLNELSAVFKESGPNGREIDALAAYAAHPEEKWFDFDLDGVHFILTLLRPSGHLIISSATDFLDASENEHVVRTLLDLVQQVIPLFSPAYGYADMQGRTTFPAKAVSAVKLTTIFWANFFGKPYVEKYGKEFLLGAPGWKTRELSDGTLEYVITPSPLVPVAPALHKSIVHYFASRAKIRTYRAVPFEG